MTLVLIRCFILFCTIVGCTMFLRYWWDVFGKALVIYARTFKWATVPCKVEETCSEYAKDSDSDFPFYYVRVRYVYEFQGKQFHGDQAYPNSDSNPVDDRSAEKLVRRAIRCNTCFANPQTPDQSVLVRTLPWRNVVNAIVMIAIILVGAITCFTCAFFAF